jgi:hypothetical protein
MGELIEALTIFTKHGATPADFYAEHDEIMMSCNVKDETDAARLKELRWRTGDEEGQWNKFV